MTDERPCGNNEKWCKSCVSKGKCNYTKKQDIIAELEKIKEKISKLARYYTTENGRINLVIDNSVYRIIDKEIAELKGENNETCN